MRREGEGGAVAVAALAVLGHVDALVAAGGEEREEEESRQQEGDMAVGRFHFRASKSKGRVKRRSFEP